MAVSKIKADMAYVDVSLADITIPSSGYIAVALSIPSGYMAYAWEWYGSYYDETVDIQLYYRPTAGDPNHIIIKGPAKALNQGTIRVLYRKI